MCILLVSLNTILPIARQEVFSGNLVFHEGTGDPPAHGEFVLFNIGSLPVRLDKGRDG